MVLRSAQDARAAAVLRAPSDGWPSNAIRRAFGATLRGPRYSMRQLTLTPPS